MISAADLARVQAQLTLLYDALARSDALAHLEDYVTFLDRMRAELYAIPTRVLDDGAARSGFGRSIEEQIAFAELILSARRTALGLVSDERFERAR